MRSIKFVVPTFLMVCLLFMAGSVSAEIRPGAITLTPLIGGYVFEGNQDLDDGLTYGLSLGYHFTEHWALEGTLNYIDTELEDSGHDVDTYLYHIDALYHFMPSEKLVPYFAVGIGGIIFDPEDMSSDQDLSLNYGAGLKYFLTENIALRGDVRHVYSYEPSQSNLLYTLGLTFLFGGEKAKEISYEAPKVVEAPKPVEKPKPKLVEPPKDSDGDGVPDNLDKCPNTPKGATVNEVGCWVCKDLKFDFDKWDIKPQYYPCLNEEVDYLKSMPEMKVEIQGHTDNVGGQEYNQNLSEKRAMAVMNYLVSKGIAEDRLSIKGFGFSKPIARNDTAEGRAMNRRVQFKSISE